MSAASNFPHHADFFQMSKEKGLLFRNYVPKVVDCLEDADGVVRETAKAIVIELFQYDALPTLDLTP
jgi:vesicle coat complex subunit